MRTILIQGAVDGEINELVSEFPVGEWYTFRGYSFYETQINNTKIVIEKTEMGIMNACIATMAAIEKYHPVCIVNQGTAGGHTRDMKITDIIIGETSVYINNMRTPVKNKSEGSNSLEWTPDLENPNDLKADVSLLEIAESIHYEGKKLVGKLGSGDLFSRETDRIDLMHSWFGELCEDMESVGVYKACLSCETPVISIRIISNNEITGDHESSEMFSAVQLKLQKYIIQYIKALEEKF